MQNLKKMYISITIFLINHNFLTTLHKSEMHHSVLSNFEIYLFSVLNEIFLIFKMILSLHMLIRLLIIMLPSANNTNITFQLMQ